MSELLTEPLEGTALAHDAIEALRNSVYDTCSTEISVECLPVLDALAQHSDDLRALNARALHPNPLMASASLLPAVKLLNDASAQIEAILVWQSYTDTTTDKLVDRRLVGWFAVRKTRALLLAGPQYTETWHHLYSYIGHPIIDRLHGDVTLRALFDFALPSTGAHKRLMLSKIPGSGPLFDAIKAVALDKNLLMHEFGRHERAALCTDLSGEDYLKSTLSSKKRKEFRRLKNRLADNGEVEFEAYQPADDIGPWIDDFLQLEASGWKGRKHTAFENRADWTEFLRTSTTRLAAEGHIKIWRLTVDGKTVAITIAHHFGAHAWLTKIAYDEEYAKYSPGVLLVLEVTKAAADDATITDFDSCAIPDHPMINRLWREKVAISDLLIGDARSSAKSSFDLTVRLITARRKARAFAKSIYHTYLKGASR